MLNQGDASQMETSNNDNDYYDLDELLSIIEEIKLNGEGEFNSLKALHCLCSEIKELKKQLSYIHSFIKPIF